MPLKGDSDIGHTGPRLGHPEHRRRVRTVPGQGLGTQRLHRLIPVLVPATRVSSAHVQACSVLMNPVLIGVPRGSRLEAPAAVTSAGAEITLRATGRQM